LKLAKKKTAINRIWQEAWRINKPKVEFMAVVDVDGQSIPEVSETMAEEDTRSRNDIQIVPLSFRNI
jgi:hypothetical protein